MPDLVQTEWPQTPDEDRTPSQVVFLNLMKLVFRGEMTVVDANKFLDELGAEPEVRFWGTQTIVNQKSGRCSVHHIKWVNGAWQNGTKDWQAEVNQTVRDR